MSKDAPSANRTKTSPIHGGPHFTASLLTPKHSPFNRSVWTLLPDYPLFEATTQFSPLLTTAAPEVPYSYLAPSPLQEKESPNCTSNMCIDGLGSPPS